MRPPLRPVDEQRRLDALKDYGVLDTPREQSFDDLNALAAQICEAPIALISLIDEKRQWFKSAIGLPFSETSRDVSICAHGILEPDVFTVANAIDDERFVDNPLVAGEPQIRFYAGAPLVSPGGSTIGMLCVMDRRRRQLTPSQLEALRMLSRQVIAQLELRRKMRELEESEYRLMQVFRNCPVPLTIHRREERTFVDVNEAFTRLVGWTPAELFGRTTSDIGIVTEEDAAAARARAAELGVLHNEELMLRTRSGGVCHALVSTGTMELKSGMHALTTFVDISELKAAVNAQLASEGRYRTLFERAPDGILIADAAGVYLDANESMCAMLGYTRDELIGKRANDIVEQSERTHIAPAISHITSRASDYHREWKFRRKDGSIFPVEVLATMMPDGNIMAMIRDVSEYRRTEARFKRLVDSHAQGVMFWNQKGEIVGANDAFLGITGYAREDLGPGGVTWQAMSTGQDLEAERRAQEALLATGTCASYERSCVRKDGQVVPLLVAMSRFDDTPDEGVCFVLDLTERKRLERQFLRAQRMESIGTLAGGIAHDLNNVLAPILMSMEILHDSARTDKDRELISTLHRSAQRGAELVKQVLSFARGVEGSRVIVNPIPLARDLARVMKDTFPKSIIVKIWHDRDLWKISGDPTQLNQVMLNLCVNARDAMPNGGTLTLRLTNEVIDETYAGMNPESRSGAHVVLEVEDTGHGIPVEARDRIFEPFFTTKEVGKGTGLGLSTTLAIVKSHGGFINLYSETGRGTKFKVYLPAMTTEEATEEQAVAQTGLPRGNGEVVLIVDDESAVRYVAQRTLERYGYRVLTAENGAEAVSLYARFHSEIKVVLTDMAMPIMDGPALIVALKAMNPSVRVIGSSGLAANGGVARAIGAGVHHFAPKPYTADTLLHALRTVLRENEG